MGLSVFYQSRTIQRVRGKKLSEVVRDQDIIRDRIEAYSSNLDDPPETFGFESLCVKGDTCCAHEGRSSGFRDWRLTHASVAAPQPTTDTRVLRSSYFGQVFIDHIYYFMSFIFETSVSPAPTFILLLFIYGC